MQARLQSLFMLKNCLFLLRAKCSCPGRQTEQMMAINGTKSAVKESMCLNVQTVLKEFNWDYRLKIML